MIISWQSYIIEGQDTVPDRLTPEAVGSLWTSKLDLYLLLAAAYQPNGAAPQSSSAIAISKGQVFTPEGKAEAFPVPRALEASEIPGIAQNYAAAARNSLAAGERCMQGALLPAALRAQQ